MVFIYHSCLTDIWDWLKHILLNCLLKIPSHSHQHLTSDFLSTASLRSKSDLSLFKDVYFPDFTENTLLENSVYSQGNLGITRFKKEAAYTVSSWGWCWCWPCADWRHQWLAYIHALARVTWWPNTNTICLQGKPVSLILNCGGSYICFGQLSASEMILCQFGAHISIVLEYVCSFCLSVSCVLLLLHVNKFRLIIAGRDPPWSRHEHSLLWTH